MGIISWVIIGGIAGWLGSMITKNNEEMGFLKNIIVGMIGSLIGGFVFNMIGGYGFTGFNIWSLLVALVGSVILLSVINLFKRNS